MNRFIFILFFAALGSACSNFNRPVVESSEIAERSAVPTERAQIAGIEYLNLCVHKDCDATRLRYTRAFRDAAVLSSAIHELDRFALDAVTNGDATGIERTSAEMPSLKVALRKVRAELDALDPGEDFAEVRLQILTRKALIAARQSTDQAEHSLGRAHQNIEKLTGEDPTMLVEWGPSEVVSPTSTALYGGAVLEPIEACAVVRQRPTILVLD